MAMTNDSKVLGGRREFLRKAGLGALGVGAAVATPLASAPAQADSESQDEKRKARYTESEHVKTFYSVNRYPR